MSARDGDGQTYYVPSDMKYPEWKKKFVEGGDKEGLTEHNYAKAIDSLISDVSDDVAIYTKSEIMQELQELHVGY